MRVRVACVIFPSVTGPEIDRAVSFRDHYLSLWGSGWRRGWGGGGVGLFLLLPAGVAGKVKPSRVSLAAATWILWTPLLWAGCHVT